MIDIFSESDVRSATNQLRVHSVGPRTPTASAFAGGCSLLACDAAATQFINETLIRVALTFDALRYCAVALVGKAAQRLPAAPTCRDMIMHQ